MSLFRKRGGKGQLADIAKDMKETDEDFCVEETMEMIAGKQEQQVFCPGIDLQRLGDGGAPGFPSKEEDGEKMDEYE